MNQGFFVRYPLRSVHDLATHYLCELKNRSSSRYGDK